jgi:transcriptional regulator with XRE-family HTH domain
VTREERDTLVLNTSPSREAVILRLARDLRAARKRLHMTVRVLASQIGISESALRRIENGTSRNTQGDTWLAIMIWAGHRGYREFAGFSIKGTLEATLAKIDEIEAARETIVYDTPESVAEKAKAARAWGERFEALGRSE